MNEDIDLENLSKKKPSGEFVGLVKEYQEILEKGDLKKLKSLNMRVEEEFNIKFKSGEVNISSQEDFYTKLKDLRSPCNKDKIKEVYREVYKEEPPTFKTMDEFFEKLHMDFLEKHVRCHNSGYFTSQRMKQFNSLFNDAMNNLRKIFPDNNKAFVALAEENAERVRANVYGKSSILPKHGIGLAREFGKLLKKSSEFNIESRFDVLKSRKANNARKALKKLNDKVKEEFFPSEKYSKEQSEKLQGYLQKLGKINNKDEIEPITKEMGAKDVDELFDKLYLAYLKYQVFTEDSPEMNAEKREMNRLFNHAIENLGKPALFQDNKRAFEAIAEQEAEHFGVRVPGKAADPYHFMPLTEKKEKKFFGTLKFNEMIPIWHEKDEIIHNLVLSRIPQDMQALIDSGVKLVVSVVTPGELEAIKFKIAELEKHGIQHVLLVMDDFGGGQVNIEQIAHALSPVHQALLRDEKVLIHCKAGRARSAMVVACVLQAFGLHNDSGVYEEYQDYIGKLTQGKGLDAIGVNEEDRAEKILDLTVKFIKSKRTQANLSAGKRAAAIKAIHAALELEKPENKKSYDSKEAFLESPEGKFGVRQLTTFKELGLWAVRVQHANRTVSNAINNFFKFIENYEPSKDFDERCKEFLSTLAQNGANAEVNFAAEKCVEDMKKYINRLGKVEEIKAGSTPMEFFKLQSGKGTVASMWSVAIIAVYKYTDGMLYSIPF